MTKLQLAQKKSQIRFDIIDERCVYREFGTLAYDNAEYCVEFQRSGWERPVPTPSHQSVAGEPTIELP